MKKVYLTGYKNQNLGDDLFFITVLERYPHITFVFEDKPSCFYAKLFKGYKNVEVLPCLKENLLQRIRKKIIRTLYNKWSGLYYSLYQKKNKIKVDAYLRIGGSIFMEPKNNKTFIKNRFIAEKKYFGEIPFLYVGCNFGPYSSSNYYRNAEFVIYNCSSICFRDTYSYGLFKQSKNVRVAPDVLFGMKRSDPCTKKKEKSLGISLIDLSTRSSLAKYYRSYMESISSYIQYKYNDLELIRLFSFCQPEGDVKAIEDLKSILPDMIKDKIEVVAYDGDYRTFLEKFSEVELLLATRFHAMILGFVYGIKTVPIIYSDKMTHVLNDIDQEVPSISLQNMSKEILLETIAHSKIIDVKNEIRDSQMQFVDVDNLLNLM